MKPTVNLLLAPAVASLGWLALSVINPQFAPAQFAMRTALAASAAALTSGWIVLMWRRQALELRSLCQFASRLERSSGGNARPVDTSIKASGAKSSKQAYGIIQAAVLQQMEELEQADQLRAAAEFRVGAATDQIERLRQLLQRLPCPVLVIDPFDELLELNEAAQQVLGLVGQETPTSMRQLPSTELIEAILETRKRTHATQRVDEIWLPVADGAPARFRVLCVPLRSDDSATDTPHVMAVMTDISNEAAIQKRNAEFVSSVSHEMKTPLASIKAYTEMLADGEVQEESLRDEFLEVINNQAERLRRLVDNLLNLARIEAGVVKVGKSPMGLNDLLIEACDVVEPRAQEKSIRLNRDLSTMYLGVLVDRDMMLQAAINLLSNAVKYTPKGGCVTIRSRMQNDQLVIEVEDTGVGLSEEDCEKVFDKFYRVKSQSDMAAGTGLGLPLTKHIVEDVHGGRMSLTSELGRGSVFRISLTPHEAGAEILSR